MMTPQEQRIGRLVDLLSAEENIYLELRRALQDEQACLVNIEAEGLDEAVRLKETLVVEARMLEESRISLVDELCSDLPVEGDRPTLSQICEKVGAGSLPLREAHGRLSALVAAVRELLDVNASFAGEAMAQVRATLQLLGRLAPTVGTYGPDGAGEKGAAGRLVRQSA